MWFIWDLSKGRGLLQPVKRENFCPGVVCCLGRAASKSPHWSQWTETADTTCALSGSIFGAGKSIEIRLRMCGPPPVPNLYVFYWDKRSCNFCLDGSAFAVDFAVSFWYRQTVPKMGPWKCFSFLLLLSCACGPKMGPPGGLIFGTMFRFIFVKPFASGLKKGNVLVSTETLWLTATGKATGGAIDHSDTLISHRAKSTFVPLVRCTKMPLPSWDAWSHKEEGIYISSISMSSVAEDGKNHFEPICGSRTGEECLRSLLSKFECICWQGRSL